MVLSDSAEDSGRQVVGVPRPAPEMVDCSVFAPASMPRGQHVMVQVFVHLPEQAWEAAALAEEFDVEAGRRAFRGLSCPVERGDALAVDLTMPGAVIDEPIQRIVWGGRPESVQFVVGVPSGFDQSSVFGTVTVSRLGLPVGHVKFKIAVVADAAKADTEPVPRGERAQRYARAFVSYASADLAEVLRRVQVLSALGITYFQDVLDLEPGQRWEQELYRRMDDCDLVLLFWSSAARDSEWVRREIAYALERKVDEFAPPEIRPVLVEGPPVPLPWPELAHLHFNDRTLYVLSDR